MKPHMGQGAAMAIEDAAMLVRCLEHCHPDDFEQAFALYRANRIERVTRVQTESRYNTWLRDPTDPTWIFGYDVFNEPLVTGSAAQDAKQKAGTLSLST
jgi:6-hydroxynicotinate 3-monooxygenase